MQLTALAPSVEPQAEAVGPASRLLLGQGGTPSASVLVIGAGPAGLAVTSQLGLRGIRATIVDALALPGGQCREVYPNRSVHDVPGLPGVTGKHLAEVLLAQALRFRPALHLGNQVRSLVEESQGGFSARMLHGPSVSARAVVIAAGSGMFTARGFGLPGPGEAECVAAGRLHYEGERLDVPTGSRLLIVGGSPEECCRWATVLLRQREAAITVMTALPWPEGLAHDGIRTLRGNVIGIGAASDAVEVAYRFQGLLGGEVEVEDFDHVLALTGFRLDLTALRSWGFDLNRADGCIRIDPLTFETSWPAVFALGDCTSYPGRRAYLTSAFHEAGLAARAIHRFLLPGQPDPPYTADSFPLDADP